MTLRAIAQIGIDLNNFRNLDLIHQGVYRLNLSVFNIKNGHRFIANPNMVVDYQTDQNDSRVFIKTEHQIAQGQILDRQNSYSSRAMLIRYSEERANIFQIVHFRTEVDVSQGYMDTEFMIEAKLQFWDMMDIDGPQNWRRALVMKGKVPMGQKMKVLSTKQIKVKKLLTGISQHLPIIFDGLHYCYITASIHSSLIDYRFRLKSQLVLQFESFRQNGLIIIPHTTLSKNKKQIKSFSKAAKLATEQAQAAIVKGLKTAANAIQDNTSFQSQYSANSPFSQHFQQENILQFIPQNMTEYFFADVYGVIPKKINKNQLNAIYYDYLKVLFEVHESLRKNIAKWLDKIYKHNSNSNSFAKQKMKQQKDLQEVEELLKPIDDLLPSYVLYGLKNIIPLTKPSQDGNLEGKESELMKNNQSFEDEEEEVKSPDQIRAFTDIYKLNNKAIVETGSTFQTSTTAESEINQISLCTGQSQDIESDLESLKTQQQQTTQQQQPQQQSKSKIIMKQLQQDDDDDDIQNLDDTDQDAKPQTLILASQDTLCKLNNPVTQKRHFKDHLSPIKQVGSRFKQNEQLPLTFAEYTDTDLATEACTLIQKDINVVGAQLFQLWFKWVEILKKHGSIINEQLQAQYEKRIYQRYLESIFKSMNTTPHLGYCGRAKLGEMHRNVAKERRVSSVYKNMHEFPIHDIQFFPAADVHPILFEELYTHQAKNPGSFAKGSHLFVLVHGFQGNPFDMRIFKACIAQVLPDALFLSSAANQGVADGDVMEMGVRLAKDVKAYIDEWCPGSQLGRLSFIGHSIGGLVIRAALPYLQSYRSKMHLYMSLSSPHLGYSFNNNGLVKFGLWILKKFKKNNVMKQLTFADTKDPEDSMLFRLSQMEGIEGFKHVALLSSFQDRYVPFQSSRIEVSKKIDKSKQGKGVIYRKMVDNIFDRNEFDGKSIYRLDVNFKIQEKNLDSWIGRTAHILFLENQTLIRMIVSRYRSFFS